MKNLMQLSLLWFFVLLLSAPSLDAQVICNAPPDNDFCRDAFEIDGTLLGNTCCGEIEGFNLCSDLETGVWYYYDQMFSATLLEIENISIEGGIGVEIYAGSCGSLTLLAQSDCTGFENRDFTVPNCNGRIFIHISTQNEGCGEFIVSMTDIMGCVSADTCEEIGPELQMLPISDGAQVCISSCLEYSCLSTCTNQSAWFQFNTDEFATSASILIDNAEFNSNISVYRATNCTDLDAILQCIPVELGSFTSVAVVPSTLYFIEVSLEDGTPGSLDVCVSTTQEFIDCSYGDIEIIRTENPNANPNGPFCPGETVEVCYELTFNVDLPSEGNGCQYLQGVVPVLGGGWDLTANNPMNQPLDNTWEWFDDVEYNVDSPVLGLGTDPNGNPILEYGTGGLSMGSTIPGGWWVTSPAPPSQGCVTDGHPDNSWGLTWPCGLPVTINHCFTMTAKMPTHITDCDDAFQTDLSITLFTFADGETGCYDGQLACAGDTPIAFEGKIDCSALVEYEVSNDEICSGGFASIPVSIAGGYEIPIRVDVLSAGNTTGAKDWVFERGSGLIPDQIINNGTSIETITYQVSFHEPETDCPKPVETFEVLVHPEFMIPDYPEVNLCEGNTEIITAPSGHDAYQWYDAVKDSLLSEDEQFTISEPGFYRLEVTEDFCIAKQIIEVKTVEPLPLALNVQELKLCNNFIGTLPTAVDLSALQMNGVTGTWSDENGIAIATPDNVDFDGEMSSSIIYSFLTNSATAPCPDTTYYVEIILEDCQCPSIEIDPLENQCAIDTIIVLNSLKVTEEPGFWTIIDGPNMTSITIVNDELVLSTDAVSGEYTLLLTITPDTIGPLCPTTSEIMFEIFAQPDITILEVGKACNDFTGTDPEQIDLDDFNPGAATGDWSTDEGIIIGAGNVVDFKGADVKDYVFTFTTDFAQSPCTNPSYETTITVRDCTCPELSIKPLGNQCLGDINIDLLDEVKDTDEPGVWEIINGPDINSIIINGDEMQISSSTIPGEYTLQFQLTSLNIGPDCDSIISLDFFIFETPELTIIERDTACNIFTGTYPISIDLNDYNTDNVTGIWSTLETGISIENGNVVDFSGADIQDYVFTFTTDFAQMPCLNPSKTTTITVKDCTCPELSLNALDNQCLDDLNIDLASIKDTPEPGFWTITDGPDVNSISLSGEMMEITTSTIPGEYTLTYQLTSSNIGPDCDSIESLKFFIFETPELTLIEQDTACNIFTGTFTETLDLDDYNPSNASGYWTAIGSGLLIDSDNIVDFMGADVQDYEFTFTTDFAEIPCLNPIDTTTIIVKDCTCPELNLNPLDNQCLDDLNIDLTLIKDTPEPGFWTLTNGPDVNSISLSGDMMEITTSTIPGEYTLSYQLTTSNIGPDCDSIQSVTFNIYETPTARITMTGEVCNEDTGTDPDFIDLNTFNPDGVIGDWSTEETGITIVGDIVNFKDAEVRDYIFKFETNTAELPCEDSEYLVTITVKDCKCPSVLVTPLENICLEAQGIDLNALKDAMTIENGSWSITNGPSISSLEIIGGQLNIFETTVAGIYEITFTLEDQDIGPICPISSSFEFEIIAKPTADIKTLVLACNEINGDNPDVIDLDDLNINMIDGTWNAVGHNLFIDADNVVSFEGEDIRDYEFEFTTGTAVEPCPEEIYTTTITVEDCSCPSMALTPVGDFCQEEQMFDLNTLAMMADPGTWSIIAGIGNVPVIQNQMLMISSNTDPGEYMLTYSLNDTNIPSKCLTFREIPFTINERPEAVILTADEVCDKYIGTLDSIYDLNDLFVSGSSGDWLPVNASLTVDSDNVVDFGNVAPGMYEFVYTTNTAVEPCVDTFYSAFITVNECNCPIIELLEIDNMCNVEDVIDLQSLIGNSELGEWTIAGVSTMSTPEIFNQSEVRINENTEPGSYILTYTLLETNIPSLCTESLDITFDVVEQPNATIIEASLACNVNDSPAAPDVIDLDDMFMSGDDGGKWETDASITINMDNTVSFNGETPGDYLFTYTTNTAEEPCVDQTYELVITVENCVCPFLAFTSSPSLCNDETSIDLSSLLINGVGDGTWSQVDGPVMNGITGSSSFEVNGLPGGEYEFEYLLDEEVPLGCDSADVVSIIINETPVLDVTPEFTVCNQNSSLAPFCIDLNAFMSGDNGSWVEPPSYNGDFSDVSNVCFDGVAEGTQYLFSYTTNTAVSPCINKTESIRISVIDCSCPNVNVSDPAPLCSSGDEINLSDLETVNTVPGSWSFISGPENVNIGNTEIFNATDFISGDYVFEFTPTTTPEPMCPQTSQVTIEVIVPLSAGMGNTIDFCENTDLEIELFNILDNADQGGEWSEISSQFSTGQAFDINAGTFYVGDQIPGTYEFMYQHVGFEPCAKAEAFVTIIIQANPIADAGSPALLTCANMEIQLGGPDLSMGPRIVYQWTELSGKTIDDPSASNPTIYEAGTYKVVVTDIIFGCVTEDEVIISEEIGFPTFDTEILPFDCENNEGGTIVIQNSTGGNGDYIYTIDGGLNWTEDADFSGLAPGTYTVTLQDGNGCEASIAGLIINDKIELNLNLGDDVEITYGENYYPLQVQTSALPEDIDSVIWVSDDQILCEGTYDECSIIEVDPEGVSTYCVRVVDVNGCEESDCVIIREILDVNVYIANVFTPSVNDFNNRFFVQTDENIKYVKSLRVFDRWGSQVFEGEAEHEPNDPDFGWDGTWKNGIVESGVFTYHVVVTDALESDHEFAGSVTLIR